MLTMGGRAIDKATRSWTRLSNQEDAPICSIMADLTDR